MAARQDSMAVSRLVRTVRQSRHFSPGSVTDDALETLLQLARWTGSSKNTQPWHFIVIRDQATLRKLSELRGPMNWVIRAPLGISIVLDGTTRIGEAFDEGRVTERLLIGARSLGLAGGVAWYGDASQQAEAKRILGIPEDRTARSIVMIGHPISKEPRPSRAGGGRKPLSELVSHERWGAGR